MKKSWHEKLHTSHGLPKVEKIKPKQAKIWGKGTIAVPSPLEVDAFMKKVPKGKITTINDIRTAVAKKHKATIGCPITCGIFANISAHAAENDKKQGKKNITPYWRTLKKDGELNEKYPGGIPNQAKLLKQEKHKIVKKGKRSLVQDFDKKLAKL